MSHQPLIEILPNYAGPSSEAPLVQARPGDAGTDLYAAQEASISPGQRILMPTGLRVALPVVENTNELLFLEEGVVMDVRPKSGLALKVGLTLLNTPGTIDSGYRGEIAVILYNSNPTVEPAIIAQVLDAIEGKRSPQSVRDALVEQVESNTIYIQKGQKIAQVVCLQYLVPNYRVIEAGESLPDSVRGEGGFGSTGIHAQKNLV